MSIGLIVLIAVAVVVLAVIFYYNNLVAKRNQADQAFSTIDVMLKNRADLIPNLVATVRQYMVHEADTLTRITELRSTCADSKIDTGRRLSANGEMQRLIGGLVIQVENYPQLKADGNFRDLARSLSGMEGELSAARRAYNASVTEYNNAAEMFPGNLVASKFRFSRMPLLEVSPTDRAVPDVGKLFHS